MFSGRGINICSNMRHSVLKSVCEFVCVCVCVEIEEKTFANFRMIVNVSYSWNWNIHLELMQAEKGRIRSALKKVP